MSRFYSNSPYPSNYKVAREALKYFAANPDHRYRVRLAQPNEFKLYYNCRLNRGIVVEQISVDGGALYWYALGLPEGVAPRLLGCDWREARRLCTYVCDLIALGAGQKLGGRAPQAMRGRIDVLS